MATSRRAQAVGQVGQATRGNRRWKERWDTWVMRSTIAAAVAHAVVFTLWPVWSVSRQARNAPLEAVQILPILASAFVTETYDSPTTALPTAEELAIDEATGGGAEADLEERAGDVMAGLREPDPSLAYPVMRTTTYGRPAPPLPSDELNLEEVTIHPRVAMLPPSVAWPLIRNPVAVVRYLRNRYNPVYTTPSYRGSVSVAMWVNERGSVEWSEVRESSGHAVLDEIALAMFNDVVLFRPARSEGSPVPVTVVIRVPFDAPW